MSPPKPCIHHLSTKEVTSNFASSLTGSSRIIFGEAQNHGKLYFASYEISRHFLPLRPRCLLQCCILGILVLHFSFHVRDQVSHPHKQRAKLEFSTPYSVLSYKTKLYGLNGSRQFLKFNQFLIFNYMKFLFLMPSPGI